MRYQVIAKGEGLPTHTATVIAKSEGGAKSMMMVSAENGGGGYLEIIKAAGRSLRGQQVVFEVSRTAAEQPVSGTGNQTKDGKGWGSTCG